MINEEQFKLPPTDAIEVEAESQFGIGSSYL